MSDKVEKRFETDIYTVYIYIHTYICTLLSHNCWPRDVKLNENLIM